MENLLKSKEFISNHKTLVDAVTRARNDAESKYGTEDSLRGHCIKYSEQIFNNLLTLGYNCEIIEGWCQLDCYECCTDTSYEEHTWVDVVLNGKKLYIDVTGDQFNPLMYDENCFEGAYVGELPDFMSYEKPTNWLDFE